MIPPLKIKSPESQWPLDNVEEGIVSKFMSPKSFCSWFFRHPRAKPINRNQTTTTWILNPFFWQLEESHEVPWKNTTKSVLEPMGRPWSQGFTVFIWFYMSLYFIYYSAVTCMLYDVPFLKKILFQIVLKSSCFVIFFRKDQIVSTKTEVVTWTNQTNIQTQKQLQTSGESTTSHRSRRATGAPKRTATKKRCRKRCHAKTVKWWVEVCGVEKNRLKTEMWCELHRADFNNPIASIPLYIYLEPFDDPYFDWKLDLVLRVWPSKIEVIWLGFSILWEW